MLYFDHWLHFSDILKKATGSKPDVTLVSFMRGGKDGIEAWGKRTVSVHSLSVGGSNESVTNYRKPVITLKSIHEWPWRIDYSTLYAL